MITIKHPTLNTVRFGDICLGETFTADAYHQGFRGSSVYAKVSSDCKANAFNYASGLLGTFKDDEKVTLIDVVVEYSLRQ
jgi:hypothetical protein